MRVNSFYIRLIDYSTNRFCQLEITINVVYLVLIQFVFYMVSAFDVIVVSATIPRVIL